MSKKIVFIGDGNVGKKNLLRRFVDGKAFDIENIHIPTIGDSQEEAIDNSKNVPIIEKNGNRKSSIYTLMDKLKLGTKMESKSICDHIQKFEKTQCQNIKIRTISQRLIDAMGFGDLTFESAADINSNHPKDKTNRSMKIDNKLKDYTKLMVSIGVILSAHHGFMFPDSEELFATLDASDQEKILDMLQNEIVTLEKMAKEDVLDEITFDPDANIDLSEIVTWEIMAKEEEFYIHIFNLFLFLYFKTYKKKEFKRLKRFIPDGTENNVLNWKNVFNKNMYPKSPRLASGLNMKNAEDLIHYYEKQETKQRRMYENNPAMLQNEIVTLDNMINDDLVEDENHYYHHKSDTMKSQKNLLFNRSILGGTCSLENENYYNKNENMASKIILV